MKSFYLDKIKNGRILVGEDEDGESMVFVCVLICKRNMHKMKGKTAFILGQIRRAGAGHGRWCPGFYPAIRVSTRINYLLPDLIPVSRILFFFMLLRI